jgi:hypothetical protein
MGRAANQNVNDSSEFTVTAATSLNSHCCVLARQKP